MPPQLGRFATRDDLIIREFLVVHAQTHREYRKPSFDKNLIHNCHKELANIKVLRHITPLLANI